MVITVVKRSVEVFAAKATGRLDFKNGRDKLSFTIVVKELVRTRQEVREAIADGSLEGQSYAIRIGGTELTTETRVLCADAGARRRFLPYWYLIRPASGMIRRVMLREIRRSAEATEARRE